MSTTPESPPVRLAAIAVAVAGYYDLTTEQLASPRRFASWAHPRQVYMYLARRLTKRSLNEIASVVHRDNHTTVMHAVRRVARDITVDETLARQVAALEAHLRAGGEALPST